MPSAQNEIAQVTQFGQNVQNVSSQNIPINEPIVKKNVAASSASSVDKSQIDRSQFDPMIAKLIEIFDGEVL